MTAPISIVALLLGEPRAPELWTLNRLASLPFHLDVVRASQGWEIGWVTRLRRMTRRLGTRAVVSRVIGARLIGCRQRRKEARFLDRLLDGRHLREWWLASAIHPIVVTSLNGAEGRTAIARLRPDIIVRVSGGILRRETFSLARIVALNVHHGMAPAIRGLWSIPWGIVEQRPDWIGATVHEIDDGIDTGTVVWRGSPQLAHGDDAVTLFFRAHVLAVEALTRLICEYASGTAPPPVPSDRQHSTYRSAPGARAWLRYLRLRAGRRAPFLVERAADTGH